MKKVQIVIALLLLLTSIARLFIPCCDAFGNWSIWLFNQIDYIKGFFDKSICLDQNIFNLIFTSYFIFLIFDIAKIVTFLILLFVTIPSYKSKARESVSKVALAFSLFSFVFTPSVVLDLVGGRPYFDLTTIVLFIIVFLLGLYRVFDEETKSAIPNRVLGLISYTLVIVALWLVFATFTIISGLLLNGFWNTVVFCIIAFVLLKFVNGIYLHISWDTTFSPNLAGILSIVIPGISYLLIFMNFQPVSGISLFVDKSGGDFQLLIPLIALGLLVVNTMICIIRKKSKFHI